VRARDSELGFMKQIYQLCDLDYGGERVTLPGANPLSNLELEDLAIAVVFIAGQYIGVNDVRGKHLATARNNEEIHRLLVKGASVFEAWPNNFYGFLDWMRVNRSNGRQTSDLHKDFGKFPYTLRVSLQSTTFDFMRLAFEEYLRSHWDGGLLVKGALRLTRDKFNQRKYISQKVALKRLKTSERLLHRFVKIGLLKVITCTRRVNKQYLLEREQVEKLRLQLNQLLRAAEVARRLGIGRVKVRDLVRDGCLRICDKFSGSGFKEWRFVESDVDGLLSAIEAKVTSQPTARARNFISFKKALSRLSTFCVGLSKFVKALLDGEISPRCSCKKNGLQRFTFSEQDLRDYSERYKQGLSEAAITVDEAANIIGVGQASVYCFISRGLLFARTLHSGSLSRVTTTEEAVRRFKDTYLLAIKIAREVGTSTRFLYNCLAEEGVNPVAGKVVDGCYQYLYERASLEKLDVADIILKAKTKLQPNGKCYATISCDQACQILEIERAELEQMIEDGRLSPWIEVPATDERCASYVFRRAEVEKFRDGNLDFTHLLSLEEALEMLGETYNLFRGRWMVRGHLTPVTFKHMPNKRFFRREDVKRIVRFKKETVNSAQAAKILGVHSVTIFKLTRAGKLKPVSGPHVDGYGWHLYSRSDVEQLRVSRNQRTKSSAGMAC
jgi:predicted site-specific integrase-resolvase